MTEPFSYKGYTIRTRERRGRPREAYGEHVTWTEVQVISGRSVVGRFDTERQAMAWIDRRNAEEGA